MTGYEDRLAAARAAIRSQIVAAARRLVIDEGMPNVSLAAVAKAAGVSRQTVYNHFSDLEEIILSGVEATVGAVAGPMGEMLEAVDDPARALDVYVRASISAMANDELAMGNAGAMSPDGQAHALDILEAFHTPLNRILHAGVDDGTFRADLDPDATSEIVFHMIGSARTPIARGRDVDDVADRVADLVGRAVR